MNLRESVVLITGASHGLGLALARQLAGKGSRLIMTARGDDDLRAAADELANQTEVVAVAGDVADPLHAERLVRAGVERFGRIDALINNASTIGPSPMPSLEAYPLEALDNVLRVNVVAPLHLMQLVLPGMRARTAGVIVNVSSDAAVNAYAGWGGYGASKAALEHASRVLAEELAGTGIRVYVVDPGDMNTAMHRAAEPGVDLSHLPGPEGSAAAIITLLDSEAAAFARVLAQEVPTTVGGAA